MKTILRISSLIVLAVNLASGLDYTNTWDSGFSNSGLIPDGNPGGWSDTRYISGLETPIMDVNVVLNISGGFNGDLYGYLLHDSGFAVLLDRVATGFTSGPYASEPCFTYGFFTSGFGSITLDQSADTDIHGVLNPTPGGGIYRPDSGGQNTDGLNLFNGLDLNGTWTLFLADLAGGETSTLVSWGLEIETVPEPTTWALIGFGLILAGVPMVRAARAESQRNCAKLARRQCPGLYAASRSQAEVVNPACALTTLLPQRSSVPPVGPLS